MTILCTSIIMILFACNTRGVQLTDAHKRELFGSRPVFFVGGRTGRGSGVPTGVRLTGDFSFRVSRDFTVDTEGYHYERGVSPSPGGT